MEKKSKTIKMEAGKEPERKGKLSYEELENVANQLNNRCKELYAKLQDTNKVLADLNGVELLLDVLGKSEYFDSEFTSKCAAKIQDILTPMFEENNSKEEK